MSDHGWMPSRAVGERYPGLIAVGGHPTPLMPEHVIEAAAAAARAPSYPPTYGMLALREAIAETIGLELGRAIDPEREVLITLGGMQGLHLAAICFGRETVCPLPGFFFPEIVRRAGGHCTGAYDWDEFAAAIGPQTTLAIVNTPANPSGRVYTQDDLAAIVAALAASDCLLLSDEAYAGVLYDDRRHVSPASDAALAERTVVLRSFSKTLGMAAWRIGFAVGPAQAIEPLAQAFAWQSLATDGVAQAAALAALKGPRDWIEAALAELAEMRPLAVSAANASGRLRVEIPEAAAFLWAAIDGDEDGWSERLARELRIPAVAGHYFGAREPRLRIPYGGRAPARSELLAALARLDEI